MGFLIPMPLLLEMADAMWPGHRRRIPGGIQAPVLGFEPLQKPHKPCGARSATAKMKGEPAFYMGQLEERGRESTLGGDCHEAGPACHRWPAAADLDCDDYATRQRRRAWPSSGFVSVCLSVCVCVCVCACDAACTTPRHTAFCGAPISLAERILRSFVHPYASV